MANPWAEPSRDMWHNRRYSPRCIYCLAQAVCLGNKAKMACSARVVSSGTPDMSFPNYLGTTKMVMALGAHHLGPQPLVAQHTLCLINTHAAAHQEPFFYNQLLIT